MNKVWLAFLPFLLSACGGGAATEADIREAAIAEAEAALQPTPAPLPAVPAPAPAPAPALAPTKSFDPPPCAARPEACK